MSGDFEDWNPDPPASQHTAPPHFEANPYGGCLRLALVAIGVLGLLCILTWKWIEPWLRRL